MAIIRSSNSSAELVIDDLSKAARTTLYHANGVAISVDAPLPLDVTQPITISPGNVTIGTVDQGSPTDMANAWPVRLHGAEGYEISTGVTGALKVDGSAFTQPISIAGTVPISGSISVSNFPATQNVAVVSSVSVEVMNDVGNAIPVSGTFFQATQPVSATSLPLPTGAATEATLANVATQSTLALIKAKTDNLDVALSTRTKPADIQNVIGSVSVSNFPATQAISATSLPLPSGASTEATLALIKAKTDNLDVALSTRTKPADTQAISAASLPLPSGASTSAAQALLLQDATFTGRINTQGQKTMAASTPVVIASDQSAITETPFIKATYRASTATANGGVVVAAASAAPYFVIHGSATKTITVHRIFVSGSTLTAVAYITHVLAKYSTQATSGTAVALTQVPLDANSPAGTAALCQVYTAAPTAGTLIGPISVKRTLAQATTAAAAGSPDIIEFDFRTPGAPISGIILRGTAQGVGLNFGAAPATAVTIGVTVEWTEE